MTDVSQEVAAAAVEGMLPPYDFEAEAAVLVGAVCDPTAIPKVVDFLRADHFYPEAHRRIFEACVALHAKKDPIDLTTVHGWLKAKGRLAQIGGVAYLQELESAHAIVANVRSYAVLVHDAWRRRQIIKTCQEIVAKGYAGPGDVQPWCEGATRALGVIGMQNPVRPIPSNDEVLSRILADATGVAVPGTVMAQAVPLSGFPTRIHGLDRILGGLCKKAKTTIAATTGVGKTALAVQLSIELAKQGVGVLFFSTEMTREELLRRALACESGVSAVRISERRLSPSEKLAVVEAKERLARLPIRIDETARITIEELAASSKAMAEQMLYQHGVRLGGVVVDYIQRLEPSRHLLHRDKHEQIGHSTKSLKILCQELDLVGLELAQAKEGPPGRKPEKPRATNCIADSSQVAKESDDVIVLVAEDDPNDDPRQSVRAYVVKQRGRGKGDVPLMFQRDRYRFIDPNTPNPMASPSRQYLVPPDAPPSEPPPGRFDDHDDNPLPRD